MGIEVGSFPRTFVIFLFNMLLELHMKSVFRWMMGFVPWNLETIR